MTSEADAFIIGPRGVITEAKIKAALVSEKGSEAELLSWEVKDFSKKGDNMWSYVTSIPVKYSMHGEEKETSYIVKVAFDYKVSGYDSFMISMFTHEETFYMKIAPEMSSALTSAGLPCLGVAKGFYCSNERGQEIILMEDLRSRDFKPFGFEKVLDDAHITLVLKALARFHASSVLVMKKHPEEDLTSWYKYPSDINVEKQTGMLNSLNQFGFEGLLALAKHVPEYEKAASWLEKFKSSLVTFMNAPIAKSPFHALCHGDLNSNNLLFRYDEMGKPVEVMFVDLQGAMFAPLTRDLNFLFFMTLTRSIKSLDKVSLLTTYYKEFSAVIEAGGEVMPFTHQELIEEVRKTQIYGLCTFTIIIPFFVFPEMKTSPESFFSPKTKEQKDELVQKLLMMQDNYPEAVKMIFDVLDDMAEAGIFDSDICF